MAQQPVSGLETHPAGSSNPNSIINGNWGILEAIFAGKGGAFIPAALFTPAAGTGASALTARTVNASGPKVQAVCFDPDLDEGAEVQIMLPRTYDLGALSVDIVWAAAGTGSVKWAVAALARGNNDSLDTAYPAETTATTAATGTDKVTTTAGVSVTPGGTPGKDKVLFLRLRRIGSDAADTLTVDAELLGVRVRYTRNQGNEN